MEITWSMKLPVLPEKLFKIAINYENYINYFPAQIKEIKVLENKDNKIKTKEILVFNTIIKKEIIQETIHLITSNSITSEILTGPFNNSKIIVIFENENGGTNVKINANLSIPLKYKIFGLVIKKVYKNYITSLLYKMMNEIQE